MAGAEAQGFVKKGFAGFHAVPWRGPGRMWQGNEVRLAPRISHAELASDDFIQLATGHKLVNGQPAHAKDQFGLENFKFARDPAGAICDFKVIGHPVAAHRFFAGETAANGGHVNPFAELFFGKAATFLEPSKKSFAGGPGKRASKDGLFVAGSLADENDLAYHRAATNHGLVHFGAKPAGAQIFYMPLEFLKHGCRRGAIHDHMGLVMEFQWPAWTKLAANLSKPVPDQHPDSFDVVH